MCARDAKSLGAKPVQENHNSTVYLFDQRGERFGRARNGHHMVAVGGEAGRDGSSDATAGAGDDGETMIDEKAPRTGRRDDSGGGRNCTECVAVRWDTDR